MHDQRSTATASATRHESPEEALGAEEHITLSQAARLAPGRPSSNCVWRWCRAGVKAACGTRARLKHVRFGSRIYTTREWLSDFGLALAEVDTARESRPVPGLKAFVPERKFGTLLSVYEGRSRVDSGGFMPGSARRPCGVVDYPTPS